MNKQGNKKNPRGGIEWTHVYGPQSGRTWNPTGGCYHDCQWQMPDGEVAECYAKTVAERLATAAYPHGFRAHYWRGDDTLREPLDLKKPAGIFVGSMADLFGHWVPHEQIQRVLNVMEKADWHTFMTLSKFPPRLKTFAFPDNVWVGVSLPANRHWVDKGLGDLEFQTVAVPGAMRALAAYLRSLRHVRAKTRWMSLEPLWFNPVPVFLEHLDEYGDLPLNWAVIGAASNGSKIYQPDPMWLRGLVDLFDGQGIPVFYKGNIRENSYVIETNIIREQFPHVG